MRDKRRSSVFWCDSFSILRPTGGGQGVGSGGGGRPGAVGGWAASWIRFLRRSSTGSMPSFCAARSTMPSVSATAIGCPTARYWQGAVLLVETTVVFARYFWCLDGPPVRFTTWLPSMPLVRG